MRRRPRLDRPSQPRDRRLPPSSLTRNGLTPSSLTPSSLTLSSLTLSSLIRSRTARRGLPGNALRPSRLLRSTLGRSGLGVAAVALGVGVLAGCGTSAASTPNAGQTCGTTRTGVNVPVIIKITKGPVSCATALRVENSYAAAVRAGQIRGNGGGAPVTVSGWTCRGFPTPEVLKTGQTSACQGGGSEIVAILPPPSAPSVPITPTALS